MKLVIDLCRQILQVIEEEGEKDGLGHFPRIEGYKDDLVFYQIRKMSEAGYVEYDDTGKSFSYEHFSIDATFHGHEFLRQMLDDTIWSKTKEVAKKGGLKLTFETVKAIIPIVIQSAIRSFNSQ